jgi:hypothetical protein
MGQVNKLTAFKLHQQKRQREMNTTIPDNHPVLVQTDNGAICKGDMLLGSGCRKCPKCFGQALELSDRYKAIKKEEQTPDARHHAFTMENAANLMTMSMRLSQGDAIQAQTILQIASNGIETTLRMESVRKMMSTVMKGGTQ